MKYFKLLAFSVLASTSNVNAQEANNVLSLPELPTETLEAISKNNDELRDRSYTPNLEELLDKYNASGVIIQYQEDVDANQLSSSSSIAAANRLGMSVQQIGGTSVRIEVSPYATQINPNGSPKLPSIGSQANELEEILNSDPKVESWYPDYKVQFQSNNELKSFQWHYQRFGRLSDGAVPGGTDIVELWSAVPGSHEVVVAVLDTGYLYDHADSSSVNVIPGYDFVSDPSAENDDDLGRDADATDPGDACAPWDVDSWHGSHVAGTIGSVRTDNGVGVNGVAKNVTILPVRVLGKCGGSAVDIIDGMKWAADLFTMEELIQKNLPRVPKKADIINLSLGGPGVCFGELQDIFDEIVASGTVVVTAAGNSAQDAGEFFPASCAAGITVAASDFDGNLVHRYSNYGRLVDIMAPGGDITADKNDDGFADGVLSIVKDGYEFFNGTSMAAPHVSGVAALILSVNNNLSPAEVEAYLKGFAKSRSDQHCPRECGSGLLNAGFLIQ